MNNPMYIAKWILVIAGLAWAYKGFSSNNIVESTFNGLESTIEIIVFGGAAVYVAYALMTKKSKK